MDSTGQVIVIAAANMMEGGLDAGGGDDRWHDTVNMLASWQPDVACLQEMSALRDPYKLNGHLWRTANALEMFPVLGPPGGASGNHTAILVDSGLTIVNSGPPRRPHGDDPAWCEVLLHDPDSGAELWVYSAHFPARSATQQLTHGQALANTIAQRGAHALALGDWNGYAPADRYTPGQLAAQPPHLRPARMRTSPDGELTANTDVHEALASVGLIDVAAALPPEQRSPRDLTPTGITGGGRPDRAYATPELWHAGVIGSYEQRDGGGSDHHLFMLTLSLAKLAATAAPGFRH
jgi:hypothetical protein